MRKRPFDGLACSDDDPTCANYHRYSERPVVRHPRCVRNDQTSRSRYGDDGRDGLWETKQEKKTQRRLKKEKKRAEKEEEESKKTEEEERISQGSRQSQAIAMEKPYHFCRGHDVDYGICRLANLLSLRSGIFNAENRK
jgi:hypothetical protein